MKITKSKFDSSLKIVHVDADDEQYKKLKKLFDIHGFAFLTQSVIFLNKPELLNQNIYKSNHLTFIESHEVAHQVAHLMASHQLQDQKADSHGITTRQLNSGLAAFNRSVRTDVYNQLPITGIRSWNIFGYCMAVLVDGTWMAFNFYDRWGFIKTGDAPAGSDIVARWEYQNMWSVFALAYYILVMNPFLLLIFPFRHRFLIYSTN